MSTSKTWAGQTFNLPLNREPKSSNWGTEVSNFLLHIADKALPKTGGAQSLEVELNFGTVAGIAALSLKSVTGTIAASGFIRLSNTEAISWRNAGNTADLALKANASNRLEFDSVAIPTISSTDSFTNKTLTDTSNHISASILDSGSVPDARVPASNVTQHNSSLVHQSLSGAGTNTHANIDTHITNQNAIITAQKEPTGFEDPDNVAVSYSRTTRKVTLTHSSGSIVVWHRGVKYTLASPFESATAHDDVTGGYYLALPVGGVPIWSGSLWDFETLAPMCYVYFNKVSGVKFGLREPHGLEPWQSHKRGHEVTGTYVRSGGTLDGASYALNTDTDVAVCPATTQVVVADEDLPTTIAAWPEGSYTRLHMISGAEVFTESSSFPFPIAGGKIQYNPTGTSLADVSANRYVNVYAIYAPTTSDAESQAFRVLWMIGQGEYTTLAAAQGEDFRTQVLGNLKTIFPEFVPYIRLSYQYGAGFGGSGAAKLQGVSYISGSRNGSVNIAGFTPTDHNSLTGRSDTASHPASAVIVTPSGNLAATDVGAALNELQSDIDSRAPASTAVTLTGAQVITNKDYDGGAASTTGGSVRRLTVPKGSTATLGGLTRSEASLTYDTTTKKLNIDDGSALKVVGGGLVVTVLDAPATSGVNLEAGKHYIVTGLTADTTLNLPAGAAEAALRVSVLNNGTSGYRVTLARNGSDTIAYDGTTTYTDAKIMYADQWLELSWRTTYWVIDDASSPLNGTFSGALTVTGAFTPSGGIVGKTDGVAIASGYVGQVVVGTTSTGAVSSGTVYNASTITNLPAGVWELTGLLVLSTTGTPGAGSYCEVGINTAATPALVYNNGTTLRAPLTLGNSVGFYSTSGRLVVNISTPTTYYLVAAPTFSTSTHDISSNTYFSARRIA